MKVWSRPCDEDCIVKAICNIPCYKLVRYANILLYEMAINPEVAVMRHPIVKGKFSLGGSMNWIWNLVDLINLNNHVMIEAAHPSGDGLTPFVFNIQTYEFGDENGDEFEDKTIQIIEK